MQEKIRSHLINLRPWQVIFYVMLVSALITDLVTALVSIWLWGIFRFDLIALGTLNAFFVSAIIMPFLLRAVRTMMKLKEESQTQHEHIRSLEDQRNQEIAAQRRSDEMALLYKLGGAIASGRNLYDSLAALQTEISKILKVDAFYVGIYDWQTDIIRYPISFDDGIPLHDENRRLKTTPGLSGAVIFGGKTIYLPNMTTSEVEEKYAPVKNPLDSVQQTFLGIPLVSNGKTFGILSVQSKKMDAYSPEQIQLLENFAIQASVAIEKATLLEQLQNELIRRNQIEADLLEREAVLEAITFSAEQFLKTPDWRENINLVLEKLGMVLNASHAYLFEKHKGPTGILLNSLRYEWVAPGQKSDLDNPDYQNAPVHDSGFERYYQVLDSGEPFVGSTSYFTESESELMKPSGIKALLEMRIVVDGKQWGTLGFDEMVDEREWTPVEMDVIRIASNVLGAAIKRQLDEAALKKELDQRSLLIDELESKNAELERFTYTVSHDLKSPIITIRGFLGFIEDDIKSNNINRLQSDIKRIADATDRMQRLLNELLDLSRIGRLMNPPQAVPFNKLVIEALENLRGQLEAGKIKVIFQPDMPVVTGDRVRLVEVLQNLVGNASNFMGTQPDPQIEIGYAGEENGKPIFFVKDNGIGIPPEHQERIFGLFNKLDPDSEGTGVGLTLVKRIIEIHGGRIWVESKPGHGATFFFTLNMLENQ